MTYRATPGTLLVAVKGYYKNQTISGGFYINRFYKWKRNGVDIPGADGPSYGVTTADIGSIITCEEKTWHAVEPNIGGSDPNWQVTNPLLTETPGVEIIAGTGSTAGLLGPENISYVGSFKLPGNNDTWAYGLQWPGYFLDSADNKKKLNITSHRYWHRAGTVEIPPDSQLKNAFTTAPNDLNAATLLVAPDVRVYLRHDGTYYNDGEDPQPPLTFRNNLYADGPEQWNGTTGSPGRSFHRILGTNSCLVDATTTYGYNPAGLVYRRPLDMTVTDPDAMEGPFVLVQTGVQENARMHTGYMCNIPTTTVDGINYQSVLNADTLAGVCSLSVVSATSDGPSMFGFKTSDITPTLAKGARGLIQAATTSTFTLDSNASSFNDFYKGFWFFIPEFMSGNPYFSGGGAQRITGYNGATKTATVETFGVESRLTFASQTNPVVVNTDTPYGGPFFNGVRVQISRVAGMTQLNGNTYYMKEVSGDPPGNQFSYRQYALYTDSGLTTPVDGTGFGTYVSGGLISGVPSVGQYYKIFPTLEGTMLAGWAPGQMSINGYQRFEELATIWGDGSGARGILWPADSKTILAFGTGNAGMFTYNGNGELCGPIGFQGDGTYNGPKIYDPATGGIRGPHIFPSTGKIWAFSADELVAVKNGRKTFRQVGPYSAWSITYPYDGRNIAGITYDDANKRIYITQSNEQGAAPGVVHVYQVTNATDSTGGSGGAVANTMSLSLPTGTATNYPYQFGRVFKQGVIANYPQVLIDGVAQTTQADIKNRWPDGSVKFAVISVVLPSLNTSLKTLTFQNQASGNNTPETKANMLANYDFDTVVHATQNVPVTSSLTFSVSGQNIPTTNFSGATIASPVTFSPVAVYDRDGNDFGPDNTSISNGNIVNTIGTYYAKFLVTNGSTTSPSFTISDLAPAVHKIKISAAITRNDKDSNGGIGNSGATGYSGQSTTITVVRTGSVAGPYSYPLVAYLTKEQSLIACANDGTFSSLASASGQFKLFKNNADVTASAAYSVVSQTNCTVSIGASTGAYTVNTLTADTGTAVLRAVYSGETINLTLTIVKSKAGSNTPAATNAPTITITPSTDHVFTQNSNNTAIIGAPISARAILNGLSDATLASNTSSASPDSRYWTSGPVCTTVILADHTTKSYDFGTNASKSLRPIFHVQFWPALGKYKVRAIVESSDTTKLQDQFYDSYITTGSASPATVYSRTAIPHHIAGRWTKSFWSGAAPATINVNHNAEYLADCDVIPYYDPLNVPTESQKQTSATTWNIKSKDLFDNGYWIKYQQAPGGRPEIALFPDWTVQALQTGDNRLQTISDNLAEMALVWPGHFREGGDGRLYQSGGSSSKGSPITLFGRPSAQLSNGNSYMSGFLNGSQFTPDADRFTFVPPATSSNPGGAATKSNDWAMFWDHAPDAFTVPYLTTGEYLWLEQLQFWASHGAFDGTGSVDPVLGSISGFYGRGQTNTAAGLPGDIRRQAWIFRVRASAGVWSVDNSKEKTYYTYLVNNAIAVTEGIRGITGGAFQIQYADDYNWGATVGRRGSGLAFTDSGFYGPPLNGVEISPLNYGDQGGAYSYDYDLQTGYLPATNGSSTIGARAAVFQQGYMILALGYAKGLGYPTDKLIDWYYKFVSEPVKKPETAWFAGMQTAPLTRGAVRDPAQNGGNLLRSAWIQTWDEALSLYLDQSYIPNLKPSDPGFPNFGVTIVTPQQKALSTYASPGSVSVVNAAASAMLTDLGVTDAKPTWDWFKANFNDIRPPASAFGSAYFPFYPGWAIIPRPIVLPQPTITTAALNTAKATNAYNFQLKATGIPNVFTWTITSGNKPSWLTLSSSGLLSGTPQLGDVTAGINLTFNCSNGNAPDATVTLSLVVEDSRPPIVITGISTPNFNTGMPWDVYGGGWWDANKVANGTTPWATVTDAPDVPQLFSINVTTLMQEIYDNPEKLSAIIICGTGSAPGTRWALSDNADIAKRPRISYNGGADQYMINDTAIDLSGFGGSPTVAESNVYGNLGSSSSSGGRIILNIPAPIIRPTSATLKLYKLRQFSLVTNSIFWLRYPGESTPL